MRSITVVNTGVIIATYRPADTPRPRIRRSFEIASHFVERPPRIET